MCTSCMHRVASPAEAAQPLYRGVRGALPRTFWVPDEQGMVCATDTGQHSPLDSSPTLTAGQAATPGLNRTQSVAHEPRLGLT